LLGTILLVLVALLASLPLGVAAAIYLSEYAPDNWFTRTINLAIINLAGVPSIVHALFGVGAFVIFFRFGTSILAASLTLAIMTLPVVIGSWPRGSPCRRCHRPFVKLAGTWALPVGRQFAGWCCRMQSPASSRV
jgi:ABC-type dipeptide/oligopeptide/nickel transport system permease component